MTHSSEHKEAVPIYVEREAFEAELSELRLREKAHTQEGDRISAARRRLLMVEVDGATSISGENGTTTLLDAFEGRDLLIAYYLMWFAGKPAKDQCEGCTWVTSHMN
jgi:predicted dithiol-disulfide oxidoreductase (DUF899 family)